MERTGRSHLGSKKCNCAPRPDWNDQLGMRLEALTFIHMGCAVLVYREWPTTKDNALDAGSLRLGKQVFGTDEARVHFTVNSELCEWQQQNKDFVN